MDQFMWAFSQQGLSNGGLDHPLSLKSEIRQASRDAENSVRETSDLKEKIKHLELISRAVWALLKEHADLTEDDLLQKVREFDLQDSAASPKQCPSCSRPNGVNRQMCLYCGADLPTNSAFERI